MRFATLILLFALSFAASRLSAAEPAPRKPNILFIAVDDLRPEFGAYGSRLVQSPNLDHIARAGLTFNRAYCQQAVCSPSRTSLLTGARPDTTKVWDLNTHFRTALPEVVTLGQHFKQHGYFVQGVGKIYHGGFDDAPSWSVPWQSPTAPAYALQENLPSGTSAAGKAAPKSAKDVRTKAKKGNAPGSLGSAFESADVPDDTYIDAKTADAAVSMLRALNAKPEPFFLAVGFQRPHLPFVAPKKYWDLYDPAAIPLAPNKFRPKDAPEYSIQPGFELRFYKGIPGESIPDSLARQLKHGYYAALSYMDAQLGKILDEYERLGLAKNTIVILWGDHGWKLGEHDAWAKNSNSENDTRAPLLLAVPGMKHAGARTDGIVEFVDIYPTLSTLAGLPLPRHLEGVSFAPLLDDPLRPWKRAAFSQFPRLVDGRALMGYSMRTDHHRLTVWVDRGDSAKIEAVELYDHAIDPQENVNIAHLPTNAALVERLLAQRRDGWRAALPPAL